MTELNILAVQNADVLRALASPADRRAIPSNKALAVAVGRDDSNLGKTLKGLIAAGLLLPDPLADGLTSDGLLQLEAINRAETASAGGDAMPDGLLALRHDQILPDPDNARQDWTSDEAKDELDALRADIVQNGLLQNLVVRPMADDDLQDATITVTTPAGDLTLPRYRLVAGERRWRAIGEAISDGDWEPEQPILTRLLDRDAKETRFAAIAENLLRRKLNPIEKAKGFEQLAELGFENKLIAERLGYTPEHVQQHRRFLKLDEADQQRMTLPRDDPKHLSVRDARQKLAAKDNEPKPIVLEPMTRLAMVEIIHAVFDAGTHRYAQIPVAPDAYETEELKTLEQHQWVRLEGLRHYGEHTGRFMISLGYSTPLLDPPLPELFGSEKSRLQGLLAEQAAAVPGGVPADADCTDYGTPWLRDLGPFTPEGQALVDERDATQAANEAARLKREAEEAQQAQDREANREVHARIAARARSLFDAHRQAAPQPAAVVELAAEAEAPTPWRLNHKGDVVAANGVVVIGGRVNDLAEARMRLLVLGINAAAGIETPEDQPDPNPTLDRPAFVARMEQELTALGVTVDSAEDALLDYLTELGIEFGAAHHDWTATGAGAVASVIADEMRGDVMAKGLFREAMAKIVEDRRPDLQGQAIDDLAAQILTAFLDQYGMAFGDDGFDWDHDGAVALVDAHLAAAGDTPTGDDGTADADADQDEAA
ncbi:MAG: hypothetical protein EPO54_06190 [Brevundimonas sp.]|nr:MAG: hypothetical protein EPO54_06190 [Brevundimonas sp.]